ncbi:MAG: putative 3-hydroxybutyryl-CoA dehydrogenase [Rhodoglobus sp.]|nr:putative 3-hydroxybutyryl-CoA dehydrogenase [Rhodoglobus sp.]
MSAPATVAVVGGGRMGSGIAQVFLQAGSRVLLVESDAAAGQAAIARVEDGLRKALAKGAPPVDLARLELLPSTDAIPALVDVVVEAVPELPELKRDILGAISRALPPDCVIATNTSSISIDLLADSVESPERFVGAHFFNPVPVSRLVEIVRGARTTDDTVARCVEWIGSIGKQSIVVRDSPGFASSRLGVLLGLEAIRMLEDGVASAEDIDLAMTLGYGHATGPLRSTDLVGLDVRLAIAEYLQGELGDRFAPPALLRRLVDEGSLGRKTGQGFYSW